MKFSGLFVVLILAAIFYGTSAAEAEEKSILSKVLPKDLGGGSGGSESIASFLKICKNESAVSGNPLLCIMCKGPSVGCFKSSASSAGASSGASSGGSAASAASGASAS